MLMMQVAAQAAKHMARAEIVELHHDRKLDKPSGTAARTASLMARPMSSSPRAMSRTQPGGGQGRTSVPAEV